MRTKKKYKQKKNPLLWVQREFIGGPFDGEKKWIYGALPNHPKLFITLFGEIAGDMGRFSATYTWSMSFKKYVLYKQKIN